MYSADFRPSGSQQLGPSHSVSPSHSHFFPPILASPAPGLWVLSVQIQTCAARILGGKVVSTHMLRY